MPIDFFRGMGGTPHPAPTDRQQMATNTVVAPAQAPSQPATTATPAKDNSQLSSHAAHAAQTSQQTQATSSVAERARAAQLQHAELAAHHVFYNETPAAPPQMPTEAIIVSKPYEVNRGNALPDSKLHWLAEATHENQALRKEATAQIHANHDPESAALGKLSPEQRSQYEAVKALTRHDPQAQLALQLMLMEGKLTGEAKAHDGRDLLGSLHALATQLVAKGIDQKALVNDLIKEVHLPEAINQMNRNTCTVTALEIKTALENPAEYARLVGGLATPHGRVTLANGQTLTRVHGTEHADDTPRTQSARLWEAALMNYGGKQAGVTYDNKADVFRKPDGSTADIQRDANFINRIQTGIDGTGNSEQVNLKAGALAQLQADLKADVNTPQIRQIKQRIAHSPGKPLNVDGEMDDVRIHQLAPKVVADLQKLTSRGKTVPVAIYYAKAGEPHGEHEVLVTGVSQDARGKQWVHYDNPWGQKERMPREDFEKRLLTAAYSKR